MPEKLTLADVAGELEKRMSNALQFEPNSPLLRQFDCGMEEAYGAARDLVCDLLSETRAVTPHAESAWHNALALLSEETGPLMGEENS